MAEEQTFFNLPNSPEEFGLIFEPSSLRKIDFTALEFDSIRRACIEYVKTYFPDQFNDFVADNGFIMVMELVSYVGSILALREDVLANEAFLPTALTDVAVQQHLKLIGQKIKPQTPAQSVVACTIAAPLISDLHIPAGTKFQVGSPDGQPLYYEIFKAPNDFINDIIIPKGKFGTVAFAIEGSFSSQFTAVSVGGPNQQFVISGSNILEEPIFVDIVTNTVDGSITERWVKIPIIERAGPNEKVFEARLEEDSLAIIFGNDEYGSIPPAGRNIVVTYRTGGGTRGRIPSGIIDETRSLNPDSPLSAQVPVRFRNILASEGGFDRESLEKAKRRGPLEAATHDSIVSGEDYSIIASNYSHPVYGAILKANAVLRSSININQIELYVLAGGENGEPVLPNIGLKDGLKNLMSEKNVFTDEIVVLDGAVKPINLEIDVVIFKNANTATVKANVEDTISKFFAVDNFEIGKGFRISNLVNTIQQVDGVKYIRVFSPKDDILEASSKTTSADSLSVGYSELLTLGTSKITYYLEPSSQQRIA